MPLPFEETVTTHFGDHPTIHVREVGGSGYPGAVIPHVEVEPNSANGGHNYFSLPDLNDYIDKLIEARDLLRTLE